jgi:hypothetical protein
MERTTSEGRRGALTTLVGAVALFGATPALANPHPLRAETAGAPGRSVATLDRSGPEMLEPGIAAPLPEKRELGPRDKFAQLTVSGNLFGGDNFGGEAIGELRVAEVFGIGLGARASEVGVLPFIRLTPVGLAIRHWAWLAYADFDINGQWGFGGAMLAPVRGGHYHRLFVQGDPAGRAMAGVGLERDLW